MRTRISMVCLAAAAVGVFSLLGPCFGAGTPSGTPDGVPTPPAAVTRVQVVITGGHETDPRDRGRPVVLVASALGVSPDVFREVFRHVRPAPAGMQPDPEQVRRNKDALLEGLSPYGVTNDRLDEVSNYYRYNRSRGEMWRNRPAAAYALVQNGQITGFVVTDGGAGYSSPPTIMVPGFANGTAIARLSFSRVLQQNGAITSIQWAPAR